MVTSTLQQLRLARAWGERLRADRVEITRHCDFHMPTIPLDAPHCADLFVESSGVFDPAPFSTRLGELLRLVDLATAPHVDPLVFNALFDDDALCAMGPTPCTRCDAADPNAVPAVTLSIARGRRERWSDRFERLLDWRSGVGIVYDALYAWDEASASAEFRSLHDALGASARDRPPVELTLMLGLFKDDGDMVIRDLQALAAREGTGRFRLARVVPLKHPADPESSHFAPLHTTILDLGVCTRLAPLGFREPATPEETQYVRQWLLDWAERANAPPPVEAMTIVWYPGHSPDVLIQLLRLVVANNRTLRRLTLLWPLKPEDEAAAEAIGAVLLAPNAHLCLDHLELDVEELSAELVAALQRGASGSSDSGARGSDPGPRFQSIKWMVPHTSEAHIAQVVELFGAVGVCELEIDTYNSALAPERDPDDRDLSCHMLKAVLQACARTLTGLYLWSLSCDDAAELEDATAWSNFPSQLTRLRVLPHGKDDASTRRAVDALLARVGGSLTYLGVGSFHAPLDAQVAETILTRCPRLVTLSIPNASAAFFRRLAAAYDDGTCRIPKLWHETGLPNSAWILLLEALQDPTSGATRNLRELVLKAAWMENVEEDVVFNTAVAMLSTNTTLTRVAVRGAFRPEAVKRIEGLSQRFVVRVPSLRRRLAFLSVFGRQRLSKLPPDVLEVVFAFAGRRVLRVERL